MGLITQLSNPDFESQIPSIPTIETPFVRVSIRVPGCVTLTEVEIHAIAESYLDGGVGRGVRCP